MNSGKEAKPLIRVAALWPEKMKSMEVMGIGEVAAIDKLRGDAHDRYIRRFPNGTTRCTEGAALEREPTPRTETSKYREEKKTIVIP